MKKFKEFYKKATNPQSAAEMWELVVAKRQVKETIIADPTGSVCKEIVQMARSEMWRYVGNDDNWHHATAHYRKGYDTLTLSQNKLNKTLHIYLDAPDQDE